MSRKPRIEFSGALYHVIQRGNNKEYILVPSDNQFDLDFRDVQGQETLIEFIVVAAAG